MPEPLARPLRKGDHVFLIDGSSFVFRAYFAMFKAAQSRGRSFTRSDGLPIGGVLTFCNMMWKLLREGLDGVNPTHMAVVFDHSGKSFRNDIYADYKGHRPEPPDELIPQFPLMRDAVRAFGLIPIEQEGFEADDLIATYARVAREAGADVTIVAGDKDLMQLVRDGVVMYDPMPGNERRIGRDQVIEKFGVPPEKVPEVQALIGDPTDNVPGVPGIGVKTAAQLIGEYGDLETLLSRAGEIKQEKRRQALIDNAETARVSRQLVLLDDHVDLTCRLDDLLLDGRDTKKLIAFLKAMEFSTLTRRVAEALAIDPNDVEADPALRAAPTAEGGPAEAAEAAAEPEPAASAPRRAGASGQLGFDLGDTRPKPAARSNGGGDVVVTPEQLVASRKAELATQKLDRAGYRTIHDLAALKDWVLAAVDQGFVALDLTVTSHDPMQADLVGFSIALAPGRAAYVPLGHRRGDDLLAGGGLVPDQIRLAEALALMKPMLESPGVLKIGHDLKADLHALERHGITAVAIDDVQLMSYVLDAGLGSHALADLAHRHFGHEAMALVDIAGKGKAQVSFEQIEISRACPYCGEQADIALRLWRLFRARLVAEHMTTVYETLERPLVPVLMRMERRGIAIDREMLSRLSGELAQKAAALEDEVQKLAGEPFNLGSPKQLGDILFGKFKLPGGKKTKTGAWSTSASVLDELAEEGHVLPVKLLEWRQLTKLKSTYTDLLPTFVNPETRRVHTTFALAATTTGRLSSADPNLQNIPVRTEEGRKIRRAFVAQPGTKLVSADYSQIELRLLAEIADIAALKKAFQDGLDIHALTASEMFGVPVAGMPGEVRRRAKAINFGIIYGISAFGLANQLGIPREEAGAYIKRYFEKFPGIRDYMEATKLFCRTHGYVTTLFGRKCHYPDIGASNPSLRAFNERAAINARLQGTAADIIRRAMVRMEPALARAKLSARMLLQVHDELVFEVPESEVEQTLPVVTRVMEEAAMPAVALSVPLHVDARAADNWDEAH
ncbi:DNA polymerase I [Rhodoplanes sp. TEM]|uniref:DNA polymerase I n=1 Tax=Rhodoplanes tepidamans TaxID=200616 RepID=A0ABT5JK39_RHOTP|nr:MULTISPECIES: DNA polymerase I [Rhodoplanes]MDC7789380.1 DNA polymerase I [Rhodoplanes tepidamans]MDC7984526.1 DNA polymerase I [Rhodoplanes sp. TEM]MDQ0357935.1 DNA polymerase-1 [Rhodoplanes tepidamans]